MTKIKIYSDYVCPFCYLGEQILEEIIKESPDLEVEVEWMPFELRPFPMPTLRPEEEYLPKVWRTSVYPMAEDLGIQIKLPMVSPQPHTHLAFEGFQYAKEKGKGHEYSMHLFEAFFKESKDIGNIDILTQLAAETGLDPRAYKEVLESRKYKEQHEKAFQQAQNIGISAVPSFQIGNKLYQGVIPKEQLKQILQEG
jgi:predicted DsbA family dithiol-disulfide isomerase